MVTNGGAASSREGCPEYIYIASGRERGQGGWLMAFTSPGIAPEQRPWQPAWPNRVNGEHGGTVSRRK